MPMSESGTPVHILGAGPGGLATAAALRERGISSVVLERSDAVGSSWRGHYDRLRLHTTRARSALPGLPLPRAYGRWVARDDLVRYLEKYAAHHRIELATGVAVHRLERADGPEGAPAPAGGARWILHANGGRRLTAPAVVVATGYNHTPHLPDWPGREDFTGELLHASRYRSPAPYAGRDVLVVGAGNTGAEIAADLAWPRAAPDASGWPCAPLRTSSAAPPPRLALATQRDPGPQAAGATRRRAGRAGRQGIRSGPDPARLPRPETGLYTRARQGATPVLDVGLVAAVRRGKKWSRWPPWSRSTAAR